MDLSTSEQPAGLSEKGPPCWVTLGCVPVSAAARSFIRGMVDRIEAKEGRKRRRTDAERRAFVAAVERFAADLVLALDDGCLGVLACPKDRNGFAALPVGYRPFMAAYRGMLDLGLIEVVTRGSWQRISEFGPRAGQGQRERIRPTAALLGIVRDYGIAQGEARQHFEETPPPLELRGAKARFGWKTVKGRPLRIAPNDQEAVRLRVEVEALNGFIAGVRVEWEEEGPPLLGWTRLFNEGTRDGYGWNKGGRLNAVPRGRSYQNQSKAERGRLRLNGEATVEIDIRASHLTIAYGIRGQSLERRMRELQPDTSELELDPYAIEQWLPREVAKAWVTVTLGQGRHPMRWPPEVVEQPRKFPVSRVKEAVLRAHPVLGDLTGITWGKLQFIESQAIIATMQQLNREQEISVLPVHDSIIVPRSAWWYAGLVLRDELKRIIGSRPLPPKLSMPFEELPAPHRTPYPVSLPRPEVSAYDIV